MKVTEAKASTACSPSRLPGLDWALNPYKGCGHACVYCYSPDILRLSPDEAWGGSVEVRKNLPVLLARERKKRTGVIGLGTVTDPYQPIEEKTMLTRYCLEQLSASAVCVQTKSDLIVRDLDILKRMKGLEVGITITTMDPETAKMLEPGAPGPERRINALAALSEDWIKTWAFLGPVIPGINDSFESLGKVIKAAKEAGASKIIYDKLRLKPLVEARLGKLLGPARARKVFSMSADREWEERVFIDIEVLCDDAKIRCERAF